MNNKITIVYTSDTHGRITAYDFLNHHYDSFGLSRLSSYLKTLKTPFLLLDNGDFLQGSPLLDYTRKNKSSNPVAKIFNLLNYHAVTIGNHDFNFGLPYLLDFQTQFQGEILCANIKKHGKYLFKPYDIVEMNDIKIALIGVTTEYIPFWEKPANIEDLIFDDVVDTVSKLITTEHLKEKSDVILVMYHGGYQKNPKTGESYGHETIENKGYELFQNADIDILLTGHQHVPQVFQKNNRITIQTSHNAKDFGVITIEKKTSDSIQIEGCLLETESYAVDMEIEDLIQDAISKTNTYLSQTIGSTKMDMRIHDPLSCRIKKHPLFQLINQIQLDYTHANISLASLPNETHGFNRQITLNDIAISFPFENDLVVLEMSGKTLKKALEKNAEYFSIEADQIVVNPKYLIPKVEHYNYDVYDGIEYTIDISMPIGNRITHLTYQNKPIQPDHLFKVAVNSYRSVGSGGFDMMKEAQRIIAYPVSYFDLISTYIEKHQKLDFIVYENYKIIKS